MKFTGVQMRRLSLLLGKEMGRTFILYDIHISPPFILGSHINTCYIYDVYSCGITLYYALAR